ncbi:MAG: hypoxanthine phosphoribosyltransferase [Bdellovibrionaceae bacterium]|nr:hypoxanthine phosphoribosyltransferase [Pseudobdellovibrionaceae bacterium]
MKLSPLFSTEEIQKEVKKMAQQINKFYGNKEIVIIGVLKGAFIFYTDLIKQLEQNIICDFCSVSFYGNFKKASASAFLSLDIRTPIKEKDVLLVDCIADHGHSLNFIKKILEQRKPKSIKTACLVVKPQALKNIQIDFQGFQVEQESFIVGYGIDYKNQGRNLNYFSQLEDLN